MGFILLFSGALILYHSIGHLVNSSNTGFGNRIDTSTQAEMDIEFD